MYDFDNKPQGYFLINIFTVTNLFNENFCNLKISESPDLY